MTKTFMLLIASTIFYGCTEVSIKKEKSNTIDSECLKDDIIDILKKENFITSINWLQDSCTDLTSDTLKITVNSKFLISDLLFFTSDLTRLLDSLSVKKMTKKDILTYSICHEECYNVQFSGDLLSKYQLYRTYVYEIFTAGRDSLETTLRGLLDENLLGEDKFENFISNIELALKEGNIKKTTNLGFYDKNSSLTLIWDMIIFEDESYLPITIAVDNANGKIKYLAINDNYHVKLINSLNSKLPRDCIAS